MRTALAIAAAGALGALARWRCVVLGLVAVWLGVLTGRAAWS